MSTTPPTPAERPKPNALPPARPRVKVAGIGCLALVMLAIYFVLTVGAELLGLALAHHWRLT